MEENTKIENEYLDDALNQGMISNHQYMNLRIASKMYKFKYIRSYGRYHKN